MKRIKNKKIALPIHNGYLIENISRIMYCMSDENYTRLFFENGEETLSSKTLKEYEQELSEYGFYRIHKTHLVNIDFITGYFKEQGANYVKLCNGIKLQVAARRRCDFVKAITTL